MSTLREEDSLGVGETASEVGNVTAMLALSEQVKFVVSDILVAGWRGTLASSCRSWKRVFACGSPLDFENPFKSGVFR